MEPNKVCATVPSSHVLSSVQHLQRQELLAGGLLIVDVFDGREVAVVDARLVLSLHHERLLLTNL